MLSLPFLTALRLTLRQIANKVERRLKDLTKPTTSTLIQATAADLIRTRPELIAENAFLRQQPYGGNMGPSS